MELFKWKDFKLPKVILRKLGKEKAYGQYHQDKNIIEIDERLKGKKLMEIYIHEFLHHIHPDFTEEAIIRDARKLTEFMWKEGFRKVDNL